MPPLIGLVGSPNSGKSSFFKAATLIDVKIASYPFTTIEPNRGVAYVTAPCPCREFKVTCNPKNSQCKDGTRLIPMELLDVAGLVPGSHAGRGKGNKFLNDLTRGHALIHIVDVSGTTDAEGNPTTGHDPLGDVKFLEEEIDLWFKAVIERNLEKIKDKEKAAEVLSGLGIKRAHVDAALEKVGLEPEKLATELRLLSKPIVIAANKIDLPQAEENVKKMQERLSTLKIIPCCAEAEIALRQAAKNSQVGYVPGAEDFKVLDEKKINPDQKKALEFIKSRVLEKWKNTGIQQCLDATAFDVLKLIPVYPVENENKLTDKDGNILPDVHLLPEGSTTLDLAYAVHTALGENFIRAIDARTKKVLGKDHVLKANDVLKIVAKT